MRIQITAAPGTESSGIYGAGGAEIPVGTEFNVDKEPEGWTGRYIVVAEGKGGKASVTNPAPIDPAFVELDALDVDAIKKLADDEKIDLGGASAKGDMIAAILKVRAAKAA